MFNKSANLYDAIYLNIGKDYAAEVEKIRQFLWQYKRAPGNQLLDVACGTGIHLGLLRADFSVEGLDLDEKMLELAGKKYPQIPFHHGDMLDFDLGRKFDIITCLFSSVGYLKEATCLDRAISNMARHLNPGGVLLVEPWFTPEKWEVGKAHATFINQPDLKIARMNISERRDRLSFFTFHYLVATPQGIEYFTELHELGLFTEAEYQDAFCMAQLEVIYDPTGLSDRGLYIGLNWSL
jgi:ubiquinone/menaquinone biosynthesis C-methylase UbiE